MECGDVLADRFVLEEHVAHGGFGIVYRGWDLSVEGPVAVKVLSGVDAQNVRRFLREVDVLAESRLPGVVRYVAHGLSDDGFYYVVMEWIEGETLAARMDRRGMDLAESVAMVRVICEPLGQLHDRGVVHRDLKPENLLFFGDAATEVKIIDFGLARRTGEARTRVTSTGVVMGTPGYMAPEQTRGDGEIDARADVFAMGCVLYECLTGYAPFAGANLLAVLSKILVTDPPPIASLCPEAPPALRQLVTRMLAKGAADRPASARQVGAALDQLGPLPGARRRRWAEARAETCKLDTPRRFGVLLVEAGDDGPEARREAVSAVVRPVRGAIDRVAGGFIIVTRAAPTVSEADGLELGRWLVRSALAVREVAADARMVVASGEGPTEVLIDRAAVLLDHASRAAMFSGDRGGCILADRQTATSLADEFAFEPGSGAWSLRGPR